MYNILVVRFGLYLSHFQRECNNSSDIVYKFKRYNYDVSMSCAINTINNFVSFIQYSRITTPRKELLL